MMRGMAMVVAAVAACVVSGLVPGGDLAAWQRGATTKPRVVTRPQPAVCASDLGAGVKTRRRFCDVIIATTPADSIAMTLPARTGTAAIMFDLHNRFTVPPPKTAPAQAFTSETAVVAIVRSTGDVIERAVVSREYRTPADLFDRLAGANATAPGQGVPVRITVPAGVTAIGLVGVRLEEWKASGRGAFATPRRSIALASNFRLEFTPR